MEFTEEHLAKEADRLFADPVLNKAIADIRAEALLDLSEADPSNMQKIIQLQERAKLASDFMLKLHEYILRIGGDVETPSQ